MGNYLKLFDTHADYNTYINGSDKVLPNVSYCENENEVHFNPYTDPRLIVKYTVVDDSNTTMIYGGRTYEEISVLDNFTKIEVDGVEISLTDLDENDGFYQLSEGEHTVKYTLIDQTEIKNAAFSHCQFTSITIPNSVTYINYAFDGCTRLTSITIPDSVTTIEQNAFSSCSALTNITIGNAITSIGYGAFSYCNSLASVTIHTTIPPTLSKNAFKNNATGRKIYVPSSSVEAYKAASGWSTYASDIQAIS